VTGATSLFDYAPDTSTDTFTLRSWPSEQTPCTAPASPTAQPAARAVAENACRLVNGGVGAYTFTSGTTRFGGNVGAGLLYEATPRFGLQGSYNFHMVNTPGTSLRFSTLQGGVRFRF
jgi:hypothetical protein